MATKVETIQVNCPECTKDTHHNILTEHKTYSQDKKYDVEFWANYQVVQCCGCHNISYRTVTTCSEAFDPETGEFDESISLYPERYKKRHPVADVDKFPEECQRIYLETLEAINRNMLLLTAIGLRATVEAICIHQKTGTNNLNKGIDALATSGHLSKTQADFLHSLRFMGNVAAHEIKPPKPQELVMALEIAETLLKTLYILPIAASKLPSAPKKNAKTVPAATKTK